MKLYSEIAKELREEVDRLKTALSIEKRAHEETTRKYWHCVEMLELAEQREKQALGVDKQ